MTYQFTMPSRLRIKIRNEEIQLEVPPMPDALVRQLAIFGLKVMMRNTVADPTVAPERRRKAMKDKLNYLIQIHGDASCKEPKSSEPDSEPPR